jgi:hypothetical protein
MSLDNSWTVGARGGYLVANDVLAYGLFTCIAILLSSISAIIPAPPWACLTKSALMPSWKASKASALPIGGLTKPRSLKRRRAYLRLRRRKALAK